MQRTAQQQAFIQALLTTSNHIALVARAGTGKSTTILEAVVDLLSDANRRGARIEIDVLMYNKAIAEEMTAKVRDRANKESDKGVALLLGDWKVLGVGTMHSRGYSLIRRTLGNVTIVDKKVQKIVDTFNSDIANEYNQQIVKLVGLAKGEGFGFFADRPIPSMDAWFEMAAHYDVNGVDDETQMEQIIELAQQAYRLSLQDTKTIDFDDMILFPLVKNMRVRFGKDIIFVDEAQDLSRTRQALARKFLKHPSGRLVIVGDDRQAIYGFSGADASAMDNLIRDMHMTAMPLTTTFRCPQSVVALARTLVPDYEAGPNNPDGEVTDFPIADFWQSIEIKALSLTKDDAILCRNTAPLIEAAYKLIRLGIPCKVEGRDIGAGLVALCQRWRVKTTDALLGRLDTFQEREVQKAQAKNNEAKAEAVIDRCQTIREIVKAVNQQGLTAVTDVIAFIENLFADGATNVTTLCTYHRSKGREWPRVWLWEHSQCCPSKAAKQDWQLQQEHNLAYVAYTRAMRQLTFIG